MRPAPAVDEARLADRLRLGLRVLVFLTGLAVVEWYLAVGRVPGLLWYLIVINVVEAGTIVYYFMHAAQLWRDEEPGSPEH